MHRTSSVVWKGTGAEGTGTITTQSGALTDQPYGFKARFVSEDGKAGTNPEELLGAAHASCFTMALAFRLTANSTPAEELQTEAKVDMLKTDAGWTIPSITLTVNAKIPGIDDAKFQELAADAKANCPISKVLKPAITLKATLAR
jgi:lipoyl-dependent peroxiredoxin